MKLLSFNLLSSLLARNNLSLVCMSIHTHSVSLNNACMFMRIKWFHDWGMAHLLMLGAGHSVLAGNYLLLHRI